MKNIKGIILLTYTLLITFCMFLSNVLISELREFNFILLGILLIIILISYFLFGKQNISLKTVINSPFIKLLLLFYLVISIISLITTMVSLINNLYYITTPITIFSGIFMFLTMILSLNKRNTNLNIFLFLFIISIIITIYFITMFPKSTLKLNWNFHPNKYMFYLSYFTLFIDLIIFKFMFSDQNFKLNKNSILFSFLISVIFICYFIYKDLSIVDLNFHYDYFPNILKFRFAGNNTSIHFDFINLIPIICVFLFKIIFYGEFLRILLKIKKSEKFNAIFYFIIFLVANTILNLIGTDSNLLTIQIKTINIILALLLLFLGGKYVFKRLYQQK